MQNNGVAELSDACVGVLQIGYFGCLFRRKKALLRPMVHLGILPTETINMKGNI